MCGSSSHLPVSSDRRSTSSPAACRLQTAGRACVEAAHTGAAPKVCCSTGRHKTGQLSRRTLRVNVMTSKELGESPCCRVCATRAATTRVLPLPGPAVSQVASTGRGMTSAGCDTVISAGHVVLWASGANQYRAGKDHLVTPKPSIEGPPGNCCGTYLLSHVYAALVPALPPAAQNSNC
jgi:hypothetical protein